MKMNKIKMLLETLERLSPDVIADVLLLENCEGVKGHCSSCPLALWLSERLGFAVLVRDDWVLEKYEDLQCGRREARLGPNVRSFLANFDQGRYPNLVRKVGRASFHGSNA